MIGLALFAAGLILLIFAIWRIYKRVRFKNTGDPRQKEPKRVSPVLIIFMVLFFLLGEGLTWFSSQLKYYRPVATDYSIGTIEVDRLDDPVKSMDVNYTPVFGDSSAVASRFYLSGDSWRFKGEVINFKFATGFLGLPAKSYKTTEFEGRFIWRLPAKTKGAMLNQNDIEGGSTKIYKIFRDQKFLNWFAEVDSFATEFITAHDKDYYNLSLGSDGVLLNSE